MMLNLNENLTYATLRVMAIKHQLSLIDPLMKEPDTADIINLALVVFSYICDAHIDEELEHGEAVEELLDNKEHFKYSVKDVMNTARQTNHVLNEFLEKNFNISKEANK